MPNITWLRNALRFFTFPLIISVLMIYSSLLNFSHAQISLDGSLGPVGQLTGPDYSITSDLGQIRGSNLFHSFGEFNVLTGESATFSGPNSVANILSRVTGGNQSFIDGLLASTIPGANLYLLNPAGVLFGANASLDVKGSFNVSTADYLRFDDGAMFHADLSKSSTLTVAHPAAFGFLGQNPEGIAVDGSFLEVREGETLSAVGGDVKIKNGYLYAPEGQIDMVSVASEGEVSFKGGAPVVDAFDSLGVIDIVHDSDVNVDTSGVGGGSIYIRGGRLVMDRGQVSSNTYGDKNGGGIDIQLSGDFIGQNQSGIRSAAFGSGNSGDIKITVKDSVNILDRSRIESEAFGSGNGGVIELDMGILNVNDSSIFSSNQGFSEGNAGHIIINTREVGNISGGSMLLTENFASGNAGTIQLDVGNLNLTDSSIQTRGSAGGIKIKAKDSVNIINWFDLSTTPGEDGDPGSIEFEVDSLNITGLGNITTDTRSNSGKAGDIKIMAEKSVNIDSCNLSSSSFGEAGNIEITAKESVDFSGTLYSTTYGSGNAGDITITAIDSVNIPSYGFIENSTFGSGDAGNIQINSKGSVNISQMQIRSETWSEGDAGKIELDVGSLNITDYGEISTTARSHTSAFQGKSSSNAGDITIRAKQAVNISKGSFISSEVEDGEGDAGNIELDVGSLSVTDGGGISTSASSGFLSFHYGVVSGNAGDIKITARDSVNVSNRDSRISSNTEGKGDAGTIELNVGSLTITDQGRISTSASPSRYQREVVTGNAGNININAKDSIAVTDSSVTTDAIDGKGGTISITAGKDIALRDGSLISAGSSGEGDAGNIVIDAGHTFLSEDSSVRTEAQQADGGNINLNAKYMVQLINSEITSSVGGGTETEGGNITIDPEFVILKNSKIRANAFEGRGGNIRITAGVFMADPNSIVSASSEKGIDGEVDIRAPVTNISGSIVPLQKNFSSAASLLLKPCAVRMGGGERSSLVMSGRDGLPFQPGDLLTSPLYDADMAAADAKVASLSERFPLTYGANYFEDNGLLPLDMTDEDSGCSTCP
ncbi:MAG: filamentous hemagglutinin N-terminal domain-containing protein [Candidatus Scalindua sp.]|nr:filamentous hemagglutinin N-terminal domain-containing protein [Candidatus Scalindua sp.]